MPTAKTIINFKGTTDLSDNIATRMIFKDTNQINPQKEFYIDYDSSENSIEFKSVDDISGEVGILTISNNSTGINEINKLRNDFNQLLKDFEELNSRFNAMTQINSI